MATATVKNNEGTVIDTANLPDTPIMTLTALLRSGYSIVSYENNEVTLFNMNHVNSRFVIIKD